MYDKLRKMIQTRLDDGDYLMTIDDSSFRTLKTYRFSFGDEKLFHHVRVYFNVCMIQEKNYISIDTPDEIIVRTGFFSKEQILSEHIDDQIKEMKARLRIHIQNGWYDYEQKQSNRVSRMIDILYNLWKNKKS